MSSIEFSELVKGRKCVVVAPSGYVKGRGSASGRLIESFDLVAKTTHMCELPDPNNELGQRCDLIYGMPCARNGWKLDFDALRTQHVKMARLQPRLDSYGETWDRYMDWFERENEAQKLAASAPQSEFYQAICDQVDCVPFTGIFAILDLLDQGAARVYAYGHDFYQTGYFVDLETSSGIDNRWHKLEPQMRLVWQLLQNEPRFDCDDNLKQILHQRFAADYDDLAWFRRLCLGEIHHFNQAREFGNTLLLRTCNIRRFQPMLGCLLASSATKLLDVLVQASICDQLETGGAYRALVYQAGDKFDVERLIKMPELNEVRYDTWLIPYNGLELYTYFDVFQAAEALQVSQVYMISLRGIIKKFDDISALCRKMRKYIAMRDEFRRYADMYDKKNCL